MTTSIIAFGVSIFEGIAGGVLQNYRLNDLKRGKDNTENEDNDNGTSNETTQQLLPTSVNNRLLLADFTEDDDNFSS